MHCVITAGPTSEALDKVRRLTNFSTGRLGTELACFLTGQGHEVTLLIGEHATYPGERRAHAILTFSSTESLRQQLRSMTNSHVDAVFHAAAVSDFTFGKVWTRGPQGQLVEIKSGKLPTRQGPLMAELVPTPKVLSELRAWFPMARLVGWKYEVEGDRAAVMRIAHQQIAQNLTDACVANGPAYGSGFGLATARGVNLHLPEREDLFAALERLVREPADAK